MFSTTWSIIFGLIAGALAFLISGRTALGERDIVGIIISSIYGIVAFIVTWWLLENILAILAGSIIVAILGGAVLFFLGPTLIAIFATIAIIISKIKGK